MENSYYDTFYGDLMDGAGSGAFGIVNDVNNINGVPSSYTSNADVAVGLQNGSASQQAKEVADHITEQAENGVLVDGVTPSDTGSGNSPRGNSPYVPYYPTAPSAKKWDYLNADLAKAYGMNKATAYQEALANTAHQREVQDLINAGLNPVLSASGGSGASSFAPDTSSARSVGGGGGGKKKDSLWTALTSNSAAIVAGAIANMVSPGSGALVTGLWKLGSNIANG